jgi:hypothetical protein
LIPSSSRGLSVARAQWEANRKKTGVGNLGVPYGEVEVLVAKDRVQQIMLPADAALLAQDAISRNKSFLPRDAKATSQVKYEKSLSFSVVF